MKILKSLFLLIAISSFSQNSFHSEINDLGYHGNISSITTKTFSDSIFDNETVQKIVSVKTRFYNKDGNTIKEIYESNDYYHLVEYKYENNVRKSYVMFNKEGDSSIYGKIIHNTNGYIKENYTLNNKLFRKDIYVFGHDFKTKTLEYIHFKDGNKLGNSTTEYFYDNDGFIKKYIAKNFGEKEFENIEFKILEKKDYGNPTKQVIYRNREKLFTEILEFKYY